VIAECRGVKPHQRIEAVGGVGGDGIFAGEDDIANLQQIVGGIVGGGVGVDVDAALRSGAWPSHDDAVVKGGLGISAQVQGAAIIAVDDVSVVGLWPDQGDVGKQRAGLWRVGGAGGIVVAFETVTGAGVGLGRVAQTNGELNFSGVTEIGVEVIVETAQSDEVFGIDRAAEPLEGVIAGVGNLDVLDGGAAADAAEGEAVDLVTGEKAMPGNSMRT